MFYSCSKLTILPNISLWKTYSLKNINSIFQNCSSLIIYPDISKWNLNNINIKNNNIMNDISNQKSSDYSFNNDNESYSISSSKLISSNSSKIKDNTASENMLNSYSDAKTIIIFDINKLQSLEKEQNNEIAEYYEKFYS